MPCRAVVCSFYGCEPHVYQAEVLDPCYQETRLAAKNICANRAPPAHLHESLSAPSGPRGGSRAPPVKQEGGGSRAATDPAVIKARIARGIFNTRSEVVANNHVNGKVITGSKPELVIEAVSDINKAWYDRMPPNTEPLLDLDYVSTSQPACMMMCTDAARSRSPHSPVTSCCGAGQEDRRGGSKDRLRHQGVWRA